MPKPLRGSGPKQGRFGMSSSSFKVSFEGEALSDGEIDVRDLAPALLSLGDLIQAANKALNGDRAHVSLKMKATEKGSFVALLSVDMSILGAVTDLLDAIVEHPDRTVAADQLMDLIIKGGSIVGGAGLGLIGILKFLRGKRPDSIETKENGPTVIIHNNVEVVVDPRTLMLMKDVATREAIEKFADRALGIPDVSAVVLGDAKDPREVVLTKKDRVAFLVPEPVEDETLTDISEREMWLKIVTSAFRDGYKWRLSDGGEKPFTATIEDADFVNAVMEAKISLSANDTLKCLVKEEQKLGPSGLTKDITVLRVLEHIPGAKQMKLL
jgi:hypothetical protein